jgi:hypothetical protein
MNKQRWLIGGAVCVLIVLGTALAFMLIPRNSLVLGSVNGREVVGQGRGTVRFMSDGKTATVQLGSHTSRVTADQIELSGGRIVKIPENCKKVELFETRDGMRLLFDGQEHK